jgi:hypothetical protein
VAWVPRLSLRIAPLKYANALLFALGATFFLGLLFIFELGAGQASCQVSVGYVSLLHLHWAPVLFPASARARAFSSTHIHLVYFDHSEVLITGTETLENEAKRKYGRSAVGCDLTVPDRSSPARLTARTSSFKLRRGQREGAVQPADMASVFGCGVESERMMKVLFVRTWRVSMRARHHRALPFFDKERKAGRNGMPLIRSWRLHSYPAPSWGTVPDDEIVLCCTVL